MRYRFVLMALGFGLFLSLMAQPLLASKIHPRLSQEISLDQNEYHKVIIRLIDRMDKERLSESLSLTKYTRQAAHALAVNKLRDHARTTQANLIDFLKSKMRTGDVKSFKSYWIDNLIRAEVSTDVLERIAEFPEVEIIFPEIKISSIPVEESPEPISKSIAGVGDNLKIIGADSMWSLGYTGQGTLACTFDTGVEGVHPALSGSYRGNNGYSHEQCWFDPVENDTFPHTFSANFHGTATMGLIVGKDDATGDTIGVAWGAEWISAGVIDIQSSFYLLDAFQWAADPDGDPNTVEDIPDVLSNSWGYEEKDMASCDDVFNGPSDNLEALGVIVMFAAGNSGSAYRSLTNPASRADNMYNSFAVGLIANDYISPYVYGSSSRGPSTCNPLIIKPNVVAPGHLTKTSKPGSAYATNYSGTSFACPHAAGAALLLRQYNPNAPVDSIKKALMLSATDIDEAGPDSTSGYGLINIPAALALMPANNQPNIFVESATYPLLQTGDTAEIVVTLKNSGLGILNVVGVVHTDRTDISIIDSSASFGNIALGSSSNNSSAPFKIAFSNGINEGTTLSVDFEVTGSGGYSKDLHLHFLVGTRQQSELFTHNSGNILFTVSNYGHYGFGPGSIKDIGGAGFVFPTTGSSSLFEMGLIISGDSNHVSSAVRTIKNVPDQHFQVAPGGNLQTFSPGQNGDQETSSLFNDDNAPSPLGVEVTQKTFSYDGSINGNFVIIMYCIKNKSARTLNDLKISLFADWDIVGTSGIWNEVGLDSAAGVGYMKAEPDSNFRAIAVLNDEGISSYRAIHFADILNNGFSRLEKWQFATEGFVQTESDSSYDYAHMITTGPFTLDPDEVDTAAFAIIGANNLSDLISLYTPAAKVAYTGILTDADDDYGTNTLPDKFALYQNYPNPFNPSTVIEFDLQRERHVSLDIYNLLGQKIETVINNTLSAGHHKATWDTSKSDQPIPSGVYFYRLKAGDQISTKKMLLIK